MGILAFLTASRLKVELTRQRDEIARLHQMLDMEVALKQEAEKQAEAQQRLAEQAIQAARKQQDAPESETEAPKAESIPYYDFAGERRRRLLRRLGSWAVGWRV